MAIRKEALAGKAFSALKEVYDNRKAVLEKWNKEGKKVVLTAGVDIPEEMIIAAGMLPFPLTSYFGPRPSAEKYLEYSFGPVWKGMWQNLVEEYKGLAKYIVFCSSSDMYLKLFNYVRTLRIYEPELGLPEPKYVDLELVDKVYKAQERNERELGYLQEQLEAWSGEKITEEKLLDAIKLCNEYRDALNAFAALRKADNCRVLGSEALVVIGGSMFMEKAEAIKLVKAVTEEAASWPLAEGNRVYYIGSVQESTEVYELAEEAGINFVGEDHYMGDRMYEHNVGTAYTAISALVERCMNRMPSSEKGRVRLRAEWVDKKLEETGAQALLTWMNKNDEAYVWDLKTLRDYSLTPKGITDVTVDMQQWPLQNVEDTKAKFAILAAAKRKEQ